MTKILSSRVFMLYSIDITAKQNSV